MKIGFIGAGTVAQTIARHVLPHGHQVLLSNTRGPASLAPLVEELVPAPSPWAGSPILGTLATRCEYLTVR